MSRTVGVQLPISNSDSGVVEIRFEFVEMLFALTVGEIASQVATLVAEVGVRVAAASYAHLALATVLVAASWIGWKRSNAAGNKLPVDAVFGVPFLVLLLDVALVIFYFIIVRGVERPREGVVTPSAANETLWILVIFAGYFTWDFLTKAVAASPAVTSPPVTPPGFFQRLFGKEFWKRGWITLLCTVLAFIAWILLRDVVTQTKVILADITLLSLVLLFRAMKQKTKTWVTVCSLAFVASLLASQFWAG